MITNKPFGFRRPERLRKISTMKHIALQGNNIKMSSPIIKRILNGDCAEFIPELSGKKGQLFSNYTLRKFIDEEALHDDFSLSGDKKRSIRSFSTGEQKKALLSYLLNKHPDFLILDNPFDALDKESVEWLKNKLIELSKQIAIIQIFKRKKDLLPFITHAAKIENKRISIFESINEFLAKYNQEKKAELNEIIPPPYRKFENNFEELISFHNVNVSYGYRTILKNINWKVKPGEFWQLIGPNGSGKTTILSMINGDNPKAYGQNIKLFGKRKGSGESVWQIKNLIGYFTPSMTELYKHRHTAQQMIISGLTDSIGLYKKAGSVQIDLANQWLKLIGIYDKKNELFIQLSQVERRMVMIARAMIKHPPLLILDEPATGLDDLSANMLTALINKMAKEGTTSIIYVSHREEEGLQPEFIYRLKPTKNGSTGKVVSSKN